MAALVMALGAGCGDESDPAADPPASSEAAPTVTGSPSDSSSAEAGEFPGVEPATGKAFTVGNVSFRAPQGYRVVTSSGDLINLAGPDGQGIGIASQSSLTQEGLDRLADEPSSIFLDKPKRLGDVEVGGVVMYHLAGDSAYGGADQYGVDHEGYDVQFTFNDLLASNAERRRWVESVLATVEWQ